MDIMKEKDNRYDWVFWLMVALAVLAAVLSYAHDCGLRC